MIAIAGWNFYHLPRSQMLDIKKSFRLNCVIRFSWLVWCLRMVILTKVTWVFLSQENKILTKIFLSPALTVTTRCGTSRTCWSTRTGRFSGSRQPSTRWVTRNKYNGGDEDWSWVWGDLEDNFCIERYPDSQTVLRDSQYSWSCLMSPVILQYYIGASGQINQGHKLSNF